MGNEEIKMSWQEMVSYIHDNMESLASDYGVTLQKGSKSSAGQDAINVTELVYTGGCYSPTTYAKDWNEARLSLWYAPELQLGNDRFSAKAPYIQMRLMRRMYDVAVDDRCAELHNRGSEVFPNETYNNFCHCTEDHSERKQLETCDVYLAYPYDREDMDAVREIFYLARKFFGIVKDDTAYAHSENMRKAHAEMWARALRRKHGK